MDYCITGLEMVQQVQSATKFGLKYKVIFTDFSMPVMDGMQATRKIRAFLAERGVERVD